MARQHPRHEGFMSCYMADQFLLVIEDLKRRRDEVDIAIQVSEEMVLRDARQHLEWRHKQHLGGIRGEAVPAPTTSEGDDHE